MPVFPSISLSKAWYALIFVASLLPAFIIAPWLADKAYELLFERALLKEEVYHKQIEAYFSLETERLLSVLVNKADPIALDIGSAQAFTADKNTTTINLLHRLMKREYLFNTVTLYDNHANIMTSVTHGEHAIADISVQSPAFVVSQHGRTFIGSPLHLADHHFEFLIAVPLIVQGNVVGSMVTTVNTLEFWQNIQKRVTPPEGNMLYLIDGRGILLAHSLASSLHPGDLLTDKVIVRALLSHKNWNSSQAYQGFDQPKVFGIGSHINNLSWSVISEVSEPRIMLPIEKALSYLIFIVFIMHIIFGLLAIFLVRKMLKPIHDLSQAMQYAKEGNYQVVLPHSAYSELQNLIQHFTSMTQTIAKRESELQQFLLALEHLGESILITDKHGIAHYINRSFKKTTGYTDNILGKPIQALEKSSMRHTAYQHLKHCIKTGESWEGRATSVKANGEEFSSRMHISPVFEHNNTITHFVTIIQDMTQYDLLEAQLLQAQKTESIGTLVGGIAHDFNNNLAVIMGNTYLAKISIRAGKNQDTLEKINNIESLSKYAAKVVAQLMAYARQDIIQKENIRLNTVIKESLLLSNVAIPENISCTTNIADDDGLIFADKSQIQQMLMNLLNNARDALKEATQPLIELTLKSELVDKDFHKRNPSISTLHFMRLSIQDNGHGISEEVLPLIFDPFFTTKDVGSGTGLGLSMVFGMVQSHHGIIEVDSRLGKGTTFHIYFPMVKNEEGSAQNVDLPHQQHAQDETILLIDDDDDVRETTAEVLESLGYHVIQANDGLQGLQYFKQHADIAVIIVDVIMPHMGGVAFAQKLRESHPDIGIIFLTGYDKSAILSEQYIPHTSTLHKPIDFEQLQHAIQNILSIAEPK